MANTTANYINNSEMKKWWIDKIAPNFLEMEDTNLYVTGVFGYVNEVMGTIMEDSMETVNAVRQEFYPSSAKYMKSLYKMATMQQLDLPMTTPAIGRFAVLIPASLVLEQGLPIGDSETDKELFIPNTLHTDVDRFRFTVDYPIIIDAYYNTSTGTYTYTVRYDIDDLKYGNDLGNPSNKYINMKHNIIDGTDYLMIGIYCHQVKLDIVTEVVARGTSIQTIVMDVPYDGNLASFEVFYIENDSSSPRRLSKFLDGTFPSQEYFINYTLVDNKIRLSIPYNTYWMPAFNSSLEIHIYTSDGENGNYESYSNNVIFETDEDDTTSNFSFVAVPNGESVGGMNAKSKEQYRKTVIDAYSTNKTITTDSDMQTIFDKAKDDYNQVSFIKKRDDAFIRLFGAYMLLRDKRRFIVPTNTLDLYIPYNSPIVDGHALDDELTIEPGTIFTYNKDSHGETITNQMKVVENKSIIDELSEDEIYYSNPFLISFKRDPNIVGVYLNSCNYTIPISYTAINNKVKFQWIVNKLKITRNVLAGENFYKFSIDCLPVIDQDDIIFYINPSEEDSDYIIDALYDGEVISNMYVEYSYSLDRIASAYHYEDYIRRTEAPSDKIYFRNGNYYDEGDSSSTISKYQIPTIVMEVRYRILQSSSASGDEYVYKYEYIQISNGNFFEAQEGNDYDVDIAITGYKTDLVPGDTFRKENILGTKRVLDTCNLRAALHLRNLNEGSDFYYIPLTLDNFDTESDGFHTLTGYIKIDDTIGLSASQSDLGEDEEITNVISGLYRYDTVSKEIKFLSEDKGDNPVSCSVSNILSDFAIMVDFDTGNSTNDNTDIDLEPRKLGFDSFSWTNVYSHLSNESFDIITPVKYIRSYINYQDDLGSFIISEIPVVKANWMKESENMEFFINKFRYNYTFLQEIYDSLDENFSFDIKFHNTYGRSTCYQMIRNSSVNKVMLDRTDIILKLGIKLISNDVNVESFKESLVEFLRDYIDAVNASGVYPPIFFINLMSEIKNEFPEIDYIEYYGINNDNESVVQRLEAIDKINILSNEGSEYIPEYINIRYRKVNGEYRPDIDITFL